MKRIIRTITIFIIAISSIIISCEDSDLNIDVPVCIENKIEEIIDNDVSNPPTQVWKWEVDGNTYYYITANCCDQFNFLYNEQCELICAPDSGFTGAGDGNCPVFTGEIIKTLVWEDQRN